MHELNPVTFTDSASVRPTVYVALGGSGTKTLMYLRRQLYTRYRIAELPIQAYVFCDTDQGVANLSDQDSVDVIEERLRPDERWMVDLSAQSTEIQNVFQNRGAYPHIHRWFPEELTNSYDILTDGAGQIRPHGKLAFWLRYQKYMGRIVDAVEEVRSNRRQKEMSRYFPRFQLDDRTVEIVLVAGLAGGTGAGCFIDAAMAIKLHPQLRNANITAILYTADVFRSIRVMDQEFMRRNAFGALTELDGLMSGAMPDRYLRTAFDWEGKGTTVERAHKPFDSIYLVGASNRSGIDYEKPLEVFEAVGEKLALEFDASDFGEKLRSIRSNAKQHIREQRVQWRNYEGTDRTRLLFTDSYESAYSSFGIAGILYDRFRMRNVASSLWVRKVFEYLLGRDMAQDEAKFQAGKAVDDVGLTTDGIWAAVMASESARMDETAARPLQQALVEHGRQLSGRVNPSQDPLGRDVCTAANRVLADLHRTHVASLVEPAGPLSAGVSPGRDRDLMEANVGKLKRGAQRALEEGFLELLQRPEEAGIPAAKEYLDRVNQEIANLGAALVALSSNDALRPPRVELSAARDADLSTARELLEDARRIPALFFPFRQTAEKIAAESLRSAESGAAQDLRRAFDAAFDVAGNKLVTLVRDQYRSAAARMLGEVISALQGFVGTAERRITADGSDEEVLSGLQRRLSDYQEALIAQQAEAGRLMTAFDARREEYRNHVLTDMLDYDEESAEYLARRNNINAAGKARDRRIAQDLFNGFLRSQSAGKKAGDEGLARQHLASFVGAACAHRQDAASWRATCRNLEQMIHNQFEGFLQDRPIDRALSRNKEESDAAMRSRVDRKAEAFVHLHDGITQFRIVGADTYLYGCAGGETTARQFLDRNARAKDWQEVDLRSGSLLFYNEINGLPLLALETVWTSEADFMTGLMEDPREAIKRFSHRDWWMFRPIMPPKTDSEVRQNMEVSKLFWLGVCLGLITFEEGLGERFRISFQPDSSEGWRDPHPLGSAADHAVIRLRKNPDRQVELRQAVEAQLDTMRESKLKRLSAALYVNRNSVFLPYRVENEFGDQQVGGTGFRNLVFERLLEDHEAMVAQRGVELDIGRNANQLESQLKRCTYRDYDTHGDIALAY